MSKTQRYQRKEATLTLAYALAGNPKTLQQFVELLKLDFSLSVDSDCDGATLYVELAFPCVVGLLDLSAFADKMRDALKDTMPQGVSLGDYLPDDTENGFIVARGGKRYRVEVVVQQLPTSDTTEQTPVDLAAQQALTGRCATLYIRPLEDGSVDWTLESPHEGHTARVQLAQLLIDDSCDVDDAVRRLKTAGFTVVMEEGEEDHYTERDHEDHGQ